MKVLPSRSENNLLENGYYAILPISGNPPRSEPEISFITPVYFREDHNQMCIQVQNAQDTVRTVSLTIYDNQFNTTDIPLENQESDNWCGLWDASATPDQEILLDATVYLLGFERSIYSNIFLDRTAPVYASHSFVLNGSQGVNISISAVDSLAGVKTIDAYYNTVADGSIAGDWVKIGELASSSGFIPWNTNNLTAGQYRVAFAFQDNADNWNWYTEENNDAFLYTAGMVISGNAGVADATITYTGGSTTADGSGYYSFAVPSGWIGTITPSKTGYTFSPASLNITTPVTANLSNQNFSFSARRANIADFDGDGKTDPAKFVSGTVWYLKSSTGTWEGKYIGADGTYVRGSDFDGDGKTDPAKFVAGTVWYIKSSTGTWESKFIGADGTYVPGVDLDGDGKTDPAKFVSGNVWYLKSSTGTMEGVYIGSDGQFVSGSDFDGDGKSDLAKYVSSAGAIWYLKSSTGTWEGKYIGSDGLYISGSDFDGDGKSDPAKFVTSAGAIWYLQSGTGIWEGKYIGSDGTYVSGADFDGDGKSDPAKFVSGAGSVWYMKSGTGTWDGIYIGSDGTFVSAW
jgi:hypothetical protein